MSAGQGTGPPVAGGTADGASVGSGRTSHATALRLALLFAALFIVYGTQNTYLPVWLDAHGLTAAQIALTTSLPTFMRIVVTPTVAFFADRERAHRILILTLSVAGAMLLMVLAHLSLPVAIIPAVVVMMISMQTIMPLTDTVTLRAVRAEGIDYGRVRLWGSLTFVLASYLAGFWVALRGADGVLALMTVGAVLTVSAALLLPRPPRVPDMASGPRLTLRDAGRLAADPRMLLFLLCASATQASHSTFYVFGVLHWRGQGLSAGMIGTLWAISVAAEIWLFWASRRVVLIGAAELMLIGAVAGLVRWTIMAFDPPVALLVPLQLLHAGSFAANHLGAMHWIVRYVPEHQAGTAQALYSTAASGIASGGAILLSGFLYARLGGLAYLGMAAMCAVGVVAGLLLRSKRG